MKPDSKLRDRSQKIHPENRVDFDTHLSDSGFEEAVFEDPTQKNEKKPDPNWQKGKYNQEQREGSSEEKTYDGE